MYLLVDAGNTHIHLNLGDSVKLYMDVPITIEVDDLKSMMSDPLGKASLPESFNEHLIAGSLEFAIVASVIPSMNPVIEDWIKSCFCVPSHIVSHKSPGMVKLDYPNPETIGIDRLANSVSCVNNKPLPAVVVDFGTATTFDVINKNGAYCGGIIAPGISLMTDYLHEKTELLPKIHLTKPESHIGKSTTQAMQIGATEGYKGLIKQILKGIACELEEEQIHVTFTGGCAEIIQINDADLNDLSDQFKFSSHIDQNVTMEGLRLLAREIEAH